jgi:hypothetical protein
LGAVRASQREALDREGWRRTFAEPMLRRLFAKLLASRSIKWWATSTSTSLAI